MSRKLASVQLIKDLAPIENSDNLLVATVLGWKVVVNRSENFKVGDKVAYFEIDSFLPIRDEFEFLRKSSYRNSPILGEGFRLRTVKLRGVISQGLVMPLATFFNEDEICDMEVGLDISDRLGVKKWEEPIPASLGGDAVGKRNSFVEKSDETRIQSEPGLLDEFGDLEYYITTKYDGSSHYIAIDDEDKFHFGSHNLELKPIERPGSFYNFILEHELEKQLRKVKLLTGCSTIYVIGEWCGAGIQKNRLDLQRPNWYPFTVAIDGTRLGLNRMIDVVDVLGLRMVAVEEVGKNLKNMYPTIDDLVERSGRNTKEIYQKECEGIVIRPTVPVYSEILNGYLSMKVINPKYLLKK